MPTCWEICSYCPLALPLLPPTTTTLPYHHHHLPGLAVVLYSPYYLPQGSVVVMSPCLPCWFCPMPVPSLPFSLAHPYPILLPPFFSLVGWCALPCYFPPPWIRVPTTTHLFALPLPTPSLGGGRFLPLGSGGLFICLPLPWRTAPHAPAPSQEIHTCALPPHPMCLTLQGQDGLTCRALTALAPTPTPPPLFTLHTLTPHTPLPALFFIITYHFALTFLPLPFLPYLVAHAGPCIWCLPCLHLISCIHFPGRMPLASHVYLPGREVLVLPSPQCPRPSRSLCFPCSLQCPTALALTPRYLPRTPAWFIHRPPGSATPCLVSVGRGFFLVPCPVLLLACQVPPFPSDLCLPLPIVVGGQTPTPPAYTRLLPLPLHITCALPHTPFLPRTSPAFLPSAWEVVRFLPSIPHTRLIPCLPRHSPWRLPALFPFPPPVAGSRRRRPFPLFPSLHFFPTYHCPTGGMNTFGTGRSTPLPPHALGFYPTL